MVFNDLIELYYVVNGLHERSGAKTGAQNEAQNRGSGQVPFSENTWEPNSGTFDSLAQKWCPILRKIELFFVSKFQPSSPHDSIT